MSDLHFILGLYLILYVSKIIYYNVSSKNVKFDNFLSNKNNAYSTIVSEDSQNSGLEHEPEACLPSIDLKQCMRYMSMQFDR